MFALVISASLLVGEDAKKPDVQALIKKLESALSTDVVAAAEELAKLGPSAKEAVPALIAAFRRAQFADAMRATGRALAKIGTDAKPAVPVLIERLKGGPIVQERIAIIESLGDFGPTAKEAVPLLNILFRNSLGEERRAVQAALRKIQTPTKDKKDSGK
jgi:hypothetical protein